MQPSLLNSYWVLPRVLLAGEHPGGVNRTQDAQARVQQLLNAGINCFIDLTQIGECVDYRSLLPGQADYLRAAILDGGVPAQPAQMRQVLDYLRRALHSGRHVYVHCRAGIGRTGTVVGCYLAEQGLDGEAALQQLNQLWQSCGRARDWPAVPQTPEQAEYILDWSRQRLSGSDTVRA